MIVVRRPRFLPDPDRRESTFVGDLLRSETVGGLVALVAAAVALVWANTAAHSYQALRHLSLGPLDLEHWAADGALTVFFFVAGLELKRELLVGSLRRPADAAVPVVAAFCGVAVPAGLFTVLNVDSGNLGGWAIPAATDIAFAVAVLAVVGRWLPGQLRAFLLTLAVVDDLVVIVIIATVYTSSLHLVPLAGAAGLLTAYALLQRRRVRAALVYLPLVGAVWWLTLQSGVHATVAGVALGLLTRVRPDPIEQHSPAERLEHRISPVSAGVAVPVFAFMSAGVPLTGGLHQLTSPLTMGIVAGLVLGKPIGILGGSWVLTRFTHADIDAEIGWRDLTGVAVLAGIGFTVSMLVSDLAFDDPRRDEAKAAVLLASLLSAALATVILSRRNRRHLRAATEETGSSG